MLIVNLVSHGTNDTAIPHAAPDGEHLARIHDRVLDDLITLRHSGTVPASKLHCAGIPAVAVLEAEYRRRQSAAVEGAS